MNMQNKSTQDLIKQSLITQSLKSITVIDGRYYNSTKDLTNFFSEYTLIKNRVIVEIEYLILLANNLTKVDSKLVKINIYNISLLRSIYINFNINDAIRIKEIESVTKHDVKAVEYFIKEKIGSLSENDMYSCLEYLLPYVHFGLTSNDINSVANAISLHDFVKKVYIPKINNIKNNLTSSFEKYNDLPYPTYTHGQPATPSMFYKEIKVFLERLDNELEVLNNYKFEAKFGGAIGNCNIHKFVYEDVTNWPVILNKFLNKFNLKRQTYTTQIEHYDNVSRLFDNIKRINNILIDFCTDIWLYISKDLIKQKVVKEEVGSSTMPHKVNPIFFENAEGNLKLSNCMLEFMSSKLPISRMQRDLTDSTVTRNYGSIFGYALISYDSILKGLERIEPNIMKINEELNNYILLAEPVQSFLKAKGIENGYEILKDFTRTKNYISKEDYQNFIKELLEKYEKNLTKIEISNEEYNNLINLDPKIYNGYY